ncbi:putative reverse transcriptase domain-containing protein [Tanacetum coccineum]
MPFGLTNTPAVFMDLMDRVCKPCFDNFVIVFIDDILIYSRDKEHEDHLRIILELLKKEKLHAEFSKCDFWISIVQFLGHVIDSQGIRINPAKIEAVKDWASPTTPTEEQITKKRTKNKAKRQNPTRNGKDCERQSQIEAEKSIKSKSQQKSQLVKVKVNPSQPRQIQKSSNQEI